MMESLLNFLISNAHADTGPVANAAAQSGGAFSFTIMVTIFLLFAYFGIWRPQSKRAKEQQNLLGSLAKGDEVVTAGGLLGKIVKLTDQYIVISLANNVEIILQKTAVVNVLPKGTIKTIES